MDSYYYLSLNVMCWLHMLMPDIGDTLIGIMKIPSVDQAVLVVLIVSLFCFLKKM